MGMFDYVHLPLRCPKCKYEEKEHDWQTKSLENLLEHYRVGDPVLSPVLEILSGAFEIYTSCPNCKKSITAKAKVEEGKLTGMSYTKIKFVKRKIRRENRFITSKGIKRFLAEVEKRNHKERINIALGSMSEQKINFVKDILGEIRIISKLISVSVDSGVAGQPMTESETLQGSLNRARRALSKKRSADIGLGIEVGYQRNINGDCEMFCYSSVVNRKKKEISAVSSKFLLTEFHQLKLKNNKQISRYISNYLLKNKRDPTIRYIREMVIYRKPFIKESVRNAMLSYLKSTKRQTNQSV
jgi:non-canonical (house-cleaning) NTP pyrophosphatase